MSFEAEQTDINTNVPARVHAILARNADTAVIFRRGPSNRVATIDWDLKNDTFELGQWLHGRIYEYRCDLTPDGKYLIYFATQWQMGDPIEEKISELLQLEGVPEFPSDISTSSFNKWLEINQAARAKIARKYHKELAELKSPKNFKKPSYTAISIAPYLKAIDLWFNGSAWNGGGIFTDNRHVWINKPYPHRGEHIESKRSGKFKEEDAAPEKFGHGGECPGIYLPKLERDGWVNTEYNDNEGYFEKKLIHNLILKKTFVLGLPDSPGYGVYWEKHMIVAASAPNMPLLDGSKWRWADYDSKRHRVLFARDGKIWSLPIQKTLGEPILLHDLNPMKFEAVKAPY